MYVRISRCAYIRTYVVIVWVGTRCCVLCSPHAMSPFTSPFTPLLADLVCETDGELVARSGLHNPRESRASADLTARDAGTEWGPQQHMEDGVSVGGRG